MKNEKIRLPKYLLLFIYLTPPLCLILIFMGLRYQTIHPLYIWLSIFAIITILACLPFIKKKKKWTRHLLMGMNLFFVIMLFSPAIEFPLLAILPVLPGLKIYLISLFLYFGFFFTIFLSNEKILDYYALLEEEATKTKENKLEKLKKWRKMFLISATTIFVVFTATGIFMVSRTNLIINKKGNKNTAEYIADISRKYGRQKKQKNTNNEMKYFSNSLITFKYHAELKIQKEKNKVTVFKEIKDKKYVICSFEKRPYFAGLNTFIKQLILMRYVTFARRGYNIIEVNTFKVKNKNKVGAYIQVKNRREIITTEKINNGAIISYFVIARGTKKYVINITKTLNVKQ